MKNNQSTDLIIGVKVGKSALLSNFIEFKGLEFSLAPLSIIQAHLAKDNEAVNMYLAKAQTDNSFIPAWDLAHYCKEENKHILDFAEPDQNSEYIYQDYDDTDEIYGLFKDRCQKPTDFLDMWPHPDPTSAIWHLDNEHSELKTARDTVMNSEYNAIVRIAHFDTGYSNHIMKPPHLNYGLGRSFIKDEDENDPSDRGQGLNRGHGTGTLGILAGGILSRPDLGFNDFLGGAPFAEVVPFRISQSVILLKTSSLVAALDHVINTYDNPATRCDIITMSMGGLGTWALTAKINELYEKGIFMVSATGNNFGSRTPFHVIYPAKYKRVVGAAGVTYDQTPYYKLNPLSLVMQGNYGPPKAMHTVMAAYSPNIPWARMNCGDSIRLSGGGTSAATPQIAAAAAIYLRRYRQEIDSLPGWKKVEAIKNALFNSARPGNKLFFGRGILRANEALSKKPDAFLLIKEDRDMMLFPITFPAFVEDNADPFTIEMIETEITQLIQCSREFQKIIVNQDGEELEFKDLSKPEKGNFIDGLIGMEQSSQILKNYLIKCREKLIF